MKVKVEFRLGLTVQQPCVVLLYDQVRSRLPAKSMYAATLLFTSSRTSEAVQAVFSCESLRKVHEQLASTRITDSERLGERR